MRRLSERDSQRLRQIESIAMAEPVGSPLYLVHLGLLAIGGLSALLVYQEWVFLVIVAVYGGMLTAEKRLAARAFSHQSPDCYPLVLSLLFARALAYCGMVIFVWAVDDDVFKLAAMALLIAATINIFVFHATYPQIIACVVAPMWLCFAAIAGMNIWEHGTTRQSISVALIVLCVTPYFYLALLKARDNWQTFDDTRAALNQSQKQDALGKLVSGVAHDFNNVLAVTLGTAELLKTADGPEKDALADQIIKEAEKGAALSHQLLAFSRQSDLTPAAHSIDEVFDGVSSMLARVLPQDIHTAVVLPPTIPGVFVDRNQLESAILNLAINARDAMPNGGRIILRARKADAIRDNLIKEGLPMDRAFICISITDTGSGVSEAEISRVFDPFYTTKGPGEGSGLGLSMVQGFAAQSGGIARFESQPGLGSVVSLFLPSVDLNEISIQPTQDTVPDMSNLPAKILLVEDETALRQVVALQLRQAGYAVTAAQNGDDAQRLIDRGFRPDILITDLVMPGTIQGIQLAKSVSETFNGIPIIITSGYPDPALSVDVYDGPPPVFLQKPVSRVALLKAVQHSLPHLNTRVPLRA